jgi:hypothetical protein
MSDEAREAQSLREELARSRKTIEAFNAALDRNMGRMVAGGLFNSLLLAAVVGITACIAIRFALRESAS